MSIKQDIANDAAIDVVVAKFKNQTAPYKMLVCAIAQAGTLCRLISGQLNDEGKSKLSETLVMLTESAVAAGGFDLGTIMNDVEVLSAVVEELEAKTKATTT